MTTDTTEDTTQPTTEKDIRRVGRSQRYAGLAVGAGGVILALGYRILHGHPLPVEVFVLIIAVAAVLITMGLRERANRQPRAQVRHAMDNQERIGKQLASLPGILARLDAIEKALALPQLVQRLDAIDGKIAKLPDYGQGVIDGVQMRQSVVHDSD